MDGGRVGDFTMHISFRKGNVERALGEEKSLRGTVSVEHPERQRAERAERRERKGMIV
jgi:hypothetical protein